MASRIRSSHAAAAAGAALALLAAGCDPGTSERWALEELRILGVRADPPEAAPGETVSFESLVVDPLGDGRPVARTWAVCTPDPAVGEASCGEPGRTVPLTIGSAATFTVPSDALAGLDPETAAFGIDLYVVLAAQAPALPGGTDADGEIAIKRLRVSTDPLPNRNPELAWFGPASPVVDGETVLLQAAATVESLEDYEDILGPATELLRFSWYTTGGVLERGVTLGEPLASDLFWDAEAGSTLYVVLRDDRGGMDWAALEVP